MKFTNRFYAFMQGRYGTDQFYYYLIDLYILIAIIHLFIHIRILSFIELFLLIFIFYRVFSKNIVKREKENKFYLKVKKRVLNPFSYLWRNYQDREYHIYRRCHSCKTILRLPLPDKRGLSHVVCPKCRGRNTIFTFRKQKIEVIKERRNGRK